MPVHASKSGILGLRKNRCLEEKEKLPTHKELRKEKGYVYTEKRIINVCIVFRVSASRGMFCDLSRALTEEMT